MIRMITVISDCDTKDAISCRLSAVMISVIMNSTYFRERRKDYGIRGF